MLLFMMIVCIFKIETELPSGCELRQKHAASCALDPRLHLKRTSSGLSASSTILMLLNYKLTRFYIH